VALAALVAPVPLAAACGAPAAPVDAAPAVDVVLPAACEQEPALELGRCVAAASGAPCAGGDGEAQAFVPLAPGDDMAMVRGPQGSIMFVFAARTVDIHPGDASDPASPDNPLVEILLDDDAGVLLARWRARVAFAPQGDLVTATGLYVVVDGLEDRLDGEPLRARAWLEDRAGELRCGTATFVARRQE
jgi:hypothetical protein